MSDWKFAEPPQTACFTTASVVAGAPILSVIHDYDADWLFLNGSEPAEEFADAKLVALRAIVELDAAIAELHDLDPGWTAERTAPGQPWSRFRNVPFPTFAEHGYYLEDAVWLAEFLTDIKPPDEEDLDVLQDGDLVKLIFRFAAEDADRADGQCERMWVLVTGQDENGYYHGVLQNDPVHTALANGDELQFHPRHVMAIAAPE